MSLQIHGLQPPITSNSVRKTLASLPKDLNATYDRAFLLLRRDQHQQAIRALTWVAFPQAPLIIDELAVAVLIDLDVDIAPPPEANDQVSEAEYSSPLFSEDVKFAPSMLSTYSRGSSTFKTRCLREKEKSYPTLSIRTTESLFSLTLHYRIFDIKGDQKPGRDTFRAR